VALATPNKIESIQNKGLRLWAYNYYKKQNTNKQWPVKPINQNYETLNQLLVASGLFYADKLQTKW